jgi:hypothetical protein
MSNTITLPRGDWEIVVHVVNAYMDDNNLGGGTLELIVHNINAQLDKQEY